MSYKFFLQDVLRADKQSYRIMKIKLLRSDMMMIRCPKQFINLAKHPLLTLFSCSLFWIGFMELLLILVTLFVLKCYEEQGENCRWSGLGILYRECWPFYEWRWWCLGSGLSLFLKMVVDTQRLFSLLDIWKCEITAKQFLLSWSLTEEKFMVVL